MLTAAPFSDMKPVPRVEVVSDETPVGVSEATVWRTAAGRTMPVRGAVRMPVADSFAVLDFEAPFNVDVTYQAEWFDGGVSVGMSENVTTELLFWGTVLQQPLDPSLRAVVEVQPGHTGRVLSRPFESSVAYVAGRGAVHLGGGRRSLSGFRLVFATSDVDTYGAVDSLFGSGSAQMPAIVLVRTDLPWRVPMPLFAAVADPTAEGFDWTYDGDLTIFDWSLTEVVPPAPSVVVAPFSYDDLPVAYGTYDELEADNATYDSLARRYDLGG